MKKNPACRDSPPAAGRFSDILPVRRSAILSGAFFVSDGRSFLSAHKGDHFVILSDNEVIPSFIILPILQIFLQSLQPDPVSPKEDPDHVCQNDHKQLSAYRSDVSDPAS